MGSQVYTITLYGEDGRKITAFDVTLFDVEDIRFITLYIKPNGFMMLYVVNWRARPMAYPVEKKLDRKYRPKTEEDINVEDY